MGLAPSCDGRGFLVRAREEQPEQHDGRAAEGDEADVHARGDGALRAVEGGSHC